MKRLSGFIKKEFLHIFRDIRTTVILIGMPVIQILLFGYVITNEIKNTNIAILDQSGDSQTTKITNKLASSGYFEIKEVLHSPNQIEQSLKKGDVKLVVVFEPGFASNMMREGLAHVQLIADASDANTANMLVSYARAIITDYAQSQADIQAAPMQITQEVRMLYNEDLKGAYMFVPGTMALILMLLSAMMTSISIAREKEMGTMEVLLVSPLKPSLIVMGKVAAYIGLAFLNAIVIIVLGVFVFGMPIMGSLSLLMLESLLFICMALSLGILISSVTSSQQVAMFISMLALLLPTMLLSGFIFPVSNMPLVLQWISYIIPAKYFIIILKNIMLKGAGFMFVWKETLILFGMMVFFIILSIKKFKTRLE
ncbi:MAG: ABC transporter permease [Bacteroidales bacterium]|nr:ABC transporter permease [Bacteroidales bacterium]